MHTRLRRRRFVPQLRPDGAQALVDILRGLCILGGDKDEAQHAVAALDAWAATERRYRDALAAAEQEDRLRSAIASTHAEIVARATAAAAAAPAAGAAEEPQPMETDTPAGPPPDAATPGASDAAMATATGEGAAAATSPPGDPEVTMAAPADDAAAAPAAAAQPDAAGSEPQPMAVEPQDAPAAAANAEPAAGAAAGAAAPRAAAAPLPEPPGPRPYDFSEMLQSVEASGGESTEPGLADLICYTTRMLEGLLTNSDTGRAFVDKGGADLLLKLHTLPRLPYTFGFSASSHALLAVFRQLAPSHSTVRVSPLCLSPSLFGAGRTATRAGGRRGACGLLCSSCLSHPAPVPPRGRGPRSLCAGPRNATRRSVCPVPSLAQALAPKTTEALSAGIDRLLQHASELPADVCVPSMEAQARAAWVKVISSTAGLVAIASAVARHTTQMLPLASTGAHGATLDSAASPFLHVDSSQVGAGPVRLLMCGRRAQAGAGAHGPDGAAAAAAGGRRRRLGLGAGAGRAQGARAAQRQARRRRCRRRHQARRRCAGTWAAMRAMERVRIAAQRAQPMRVPCVRALQAQAATRW